MLRVTSVLALLAVVLLMCGSISLAGQKTVMIVYSYDERLTWTRQCDRGIRDALPDDIVIERFYMDTKRIPRHEFEGRARKAMEEFARLQPDLVIVSDDNALRLIGPEIAATGTPLVYMGINGNPRDYFKELPDNVVGVMERVPLFHWSRLLFDIVPGAQSILVLMDDSPTADAIIKSSFRGRNTVTVDRKAVAWKKAENWSAWQRFIKQPEYDIVLMPIYHALKDADGRHIPFNEVILWTSENSPVPVFASQDYAVGDQGVVGAFVIVGEEHGRLAGRIARRVLDGRPIQGLLAERGQQGALYFNPRQLRRYGIVLPKPIRERAVFKE